MIIRLISRIFHRLRGLLSNTVVSQLSLFFYVKCLISQSFLIAELYQHQGDPHLFTFSNNNVIKGDLLDGVEWLNEHADSSNILLQLNVHLEDWARSTGLQMCALICL